MKSRPMFLVAPTPVPVGGSVHDAGEAEFTSAFENAAIGMALVAPDSRRLRVNKSFSRMMGYSQAEMLSTAVHQITHPDDVDEDFRQRALCLAGEKQTYQHEKRYLHRDGHVVWGHLTCTLVRDANGRPLHFISQVQDISERKMAEQALRESEERFRSLTMLSSDWYWEQDEHFRFTAFSGTQQSGLWVHEQTLGKAHRRWDLPGLFPLRGTWEEHRSVLEAHQPFYDFQCVRTVPGDPPRYVSTSGEPVFDAEGRFRGYRGTARDITQSKLAEQRLRDTQALLHMAAQVGRLGAWAFEVGQPRMTWSEEVCVIHGVKRGFAPTLEEAVNFYAAEYQATMLAIYSACLKDGSPFDVEAQITTAKGRRVWVRAIGEAQWDERGRVVRLQGACQDITESKRAADDATMVAEQLTTTLESLTDAFFTVDRRWRFTYLNAEAERYLRRSRTELLGLEIWKAFPDLLEPVFAGNYQRAMNENVAVQFEAFYAPFGVWVQIKAYPSKQGLAIYTKDVTERIAAQQEILRLNAELEERVRQRTAQLQAANKELEAFSYSIAHDLRAPLSSIDGFSLMLEQTAGNDLAERCRHYLSRIRAGVKQMGELTDGLLSLTNLSRASLRSEPVDLAALACAAAASCRERSPERDADIEIAPTLPATGDPRLLAQVIGNLVGNAWKFTGRRERARIEVGSLQGEDGRPVYFVRDNGAGFDMAYASKMFEAFQRMHSPADFEGTGIGLAIVHKIVARHGGRIWAESATGQGATFYFTLGPGTH
ncbi:PAS domain-containing sensor histidine kinase [Caenimonas soli]|uniref:PAS domain-containing sensor histidine kinase n=1 Tax=Caenimonas soli TaxID=2735555 RepID=UPI00155245EA|nr:PAS domain S-box protein [Caenimonas soli]NPC58970.1 PAS domain S-box protein [Caenimonas soli]